MNDRVLALLPDYVLGGLSPDEAAEVRAALETDPALRAEHDALVEDLTGLAVALPPTRPPPEVRERLVASARRDRFLPFVDELARLCDVAAEKMKAILRMVDDPEAWQAGPMPGIRLIHFEHGPACLGADTGLVEMPAGFQFPKHAHLGREVNFILQGSLHDDDGTVYGPGTYTDKGPDDVHEYLVGDEAPIVMVVVHNGFEIRAG